MPYMLFYDVQFFQHEYLVYGTTGNYQSCVKYSKALIESRLDWVCMGVL
jgi:hypothetical protein